MKHGASVNLKTYEWRRTTRIDRVGLYVIVIELSITAYLGINRENMTILLHNKMQKT